MCQADWALRASVAYSGSRAHLNKHSEETVINTAAFLPSPRKAFIVMQEEHSSSTNRRKHRNLDNLVPEDFPLFRAFMSLGKSC
jgi:hypothetical protein